MGIPSRDRLPGVWPFLAWVLAGAGACVAIVTPLSIGPFVAPIVLVGIAALLIWRGSRNASAAGLLAGLGTVPIYIAYLNRGGPGLICSETPGGGQECITEWSPWPFLVVGLLLLAAGAALFGWLRRRAAG